MFESSLQQTCVLTQLSNVGSVVVREHLVSQDRICYLKKFITHTLNPNSIQRVVLLWVWVSTWGACMRFISSRRVCRCPSAGRLFFKASSRKEVHCWIRLPSMNTSTIYQRQREKCREETSSHHLPNSLFPFISGLHKNRTASDTRYGSHMFLLFKFKNTKWEGLVLGKKQIQSLCLWDVTVHRGGGHWLREFLALLAHLE